MKITDANNNHLRADCSFQIGEVTVSLSTIFVPKGYAVFYDGWAKYDFNSAEEAIGFAIHLNKVANDGERGMVDALKSTMTLA